MGPQDLLDLARVHVVTAGDDELLGPAADAQVAVRVERAEVTGAEPAIAGEGFAAGAVEVSGDDVGPAHLDLGGAAVAWGQAQVDPGEREAHRARPAFAV